MLAAAMNKLALFAITLVFAAPALAGGASNFTLVNGTGGGISDVSIRRAGTSDWKPLGTSGGAVQFNDPDCAFDIRATVAGAGPATWTGVNLCEVKSVTLKRDASAGSWVDYD